MSFGFITPQQRAFGAVATMVISCLHGIEDKVTPRCVKTPADLRVKLGLTELNIVERATLKGLVD
jgi:hypothetical protein